MSAFDGNGDKIFVFFDSNDDRINISLTDNYGAYGAEGVLYLVPSDVYGVVDDLLQAHYLRTGKKIPVYSEYVTLEYPAKDKP